MCIYIYSVSFIYMELNRFAVYLKLTQHCKLTILQLKKKYIMDYQAVSLES